MTTLHRQPNSTGITPSGYRGCIGMAIISVVILGAALAGLYL